MQNNTDMGEHALQLKQQLQELALPQLQEFIDYYERMDIRQFTLPHWIDEKDSLTLVELHYVTGESNKSILDSIDISYRPPIEIEDKQVGSINTKELDQRMSTINWSYDHFSESVVEAEMKTEEGRKRLDHVSETLHRLDQLNDNKLQGDKKLPNCLCTSTGQRDIIRGLYRDCRN